MSFEKSRWLYVFFMVQYLVKGLVNFLVYEGMFVLVCNGGYLIVEDVCMGDGYLLLDICCCMLM